MISSTFFTQFPTINYKGQTVSDITVRLRIAELVTQTTAAYYPYVVKEGERADIIAHKYYGDVNYTWLIYLINGMYDPLMDWHLTEDQLTNHVAEQYGSVAKANMTVDYYRVEWVSDDSVLDRSGYLALPAIRKKYWAATTFDKNNNPILYERAQVDWVVETNRVDRLTYVSQGVSLFSVADGDIIYQMTNGNISAQGTVVFTDTNLVDVKHVQGAFVPDKTIYVYDNDAYRSTCTAVDNRYQTLSPDEEFYWMPVTAWEAETELNESKKHIRLIDKNFLDTIEKDLRELLTK